MEQFSLVWAADHENFPLVYQIGFQQNLNIYKWTADIQYNRFVLGKALLKVNENFTSLLIRPDRDDRKWKDDQRLYVSFFYPYSPPLGLKISTAAINFSDRLSGLVSDIHTNWATAGLRIQPLSKIEIGSEVGYKYDNRLARSDRGMTYDVNLTTKPIVLKDYYNQFYFLNKGDKYSIRANTDFQLQYQVKKYFQGATVDSFIIYWTKKRRDNYDRIEIDKLFIESLKEESRGFQHDLVYGASTGIKLRVRNLINSRQSHVGKYDQQKIVETRSKNDFHSENEIGIVFQLPIMMLNFSLNYETDSQKNDIPDSLKAKRFSKFFYYISPDYKSSRLTLSTLQKYYFFSSDTLQLNGSVSIYRYDTPGTNMDDRDEFRLNMTFSEIHHFSPYLKLVSNGGVNLSHLVYIFGERSANNNWMRIFRLVPQVIYQPSERLTITHQLEVSANYVDYDYEMGTSTTDLKSYVFRRFSFEQQLNAQLTFRTTFLFNYTIELEENGKLNWDRWTEYLLTNRENHWLRVNLNYRIKNQFHIAPGVLFLKRVEKQQRYFPAPTGVGSQNANFVSVGPTLKLTYQPTQKLNVSFEGMRRVVRSSSTQHSFINHFDINLTWYN